MANGIQIAAPAGGNPSMTIHAQAPEIEGKFQARYSNDPMTGTRHQRVTYFFIEVGRSARPKLCAPSRATQLPRLRPAAEQFGAPMRGMVRQR
jgi:hypothetical protein